MKRLLMIADQTIIYSRIEQNNRQLMILSFYPLTTPKTLNYLNTRNSQDNFILWKNNVSRYLE